MTADDLRDDPVIQALAGLTCQPPGRERAAWARARCHQQLSRVRAQRSAGGRAPDPFVRRTLEPALIAAVSIVFLLDVLRRALTLFRS